MLRSAIGAFCALVSLALISSPAEASSIAGRGPALFGTAVLAAAATPYDARWSQVQARTLGSGATIAAKAKGMSGLEQLQFVNRIVNAAITYRRDAGDSWASASQSFGSATGDCEDYAIAKMQVLRSSGVPASDLFMVIGSLANRGDHAMLVVRLGGSYFVLDNLSDQIRADSAYREFRPVITLSSGGSWLHGYKVGSPSPDQRRLERQHSAAAGSSLAAIMAAQGAR